MTVHCQSHDPFPTFTAITLPATSHPVLRQISKKDRGELDLLYARPDNNVLDAILWGFVMSSGAGLTALDRGASCLLCNSFLVCRR